MPEINKKFKQIEIAPDSSMYGLTEDGYVYIFDREYKVWRMLDQVEDKTTPQV